ncbi:MAG: outer membrane protein assembly factor BamC, partial [Proteobacteria bacterium]|nr:outer membrane protein assembly factor BamC [Pseudomonadota bacterium]
KDGSAWRDREGARQYKFRVRLEPGVRSGSSELYVEQIERPLGVDIEAEWVGKSVNPELEGKMLSAMAYYLGDRMAQGPTVSLLAAGLQESKAVLETGPDGMVLKYRLQFDRAWATVGAALEDARVDVKDLDRTAANYYVHYTAQHDPDPGFLRRVFSRDDGDQDPGHAFVVNLQPEGEDVLVTVAMEQETGLGTTESLILRERLLKLIKEYST